MDNKWDKINELQTKFAMEIQDGINQEKMKPILNKCNQLLKRCNQLMEKVNKTTK